MDKAEADQQIGALARIHGMNEKSSAPHPARWTIATQPAGNLAAQVNRQQVDVRSQVLFDQVTFNNPTVTVKVDASGIAEQVAQLKASGGQAREHNRGQALQPNARTP
jgi:hypothetical protein